MHYCYYHTRLHRLANPSRPTPATGPASPPVPLPNATEPFKLPVLEDRTAIQVALSQILDGLASSKIDRHTAGLFLYGLQIASQNVERKHDILPYKAVESVTHTRDDDELAPELRVCESSDTCSTCDLRDTCKDFEPAEDSAES
jgi:hypothetical protein